MREINHFETASLIGVPLGDLDHLVNGRCTARIAKRLGVTVGDVEDFIGGSPSEAMKTRLGLSTISGAEELARVTGPEGAIGIIFGILISASTSRA